MVSSLLRRLKAASAPVSKRVTKVGIDDFAFRRGLKYGSILVDLETCQVVDLLPDRTVATATAWFKTHPDIEIVSQDRSTDYALATTLGAPQAIQVADRWHLVRNLADALQVLLTRYRPEIRLSREDDVWTSETPSTSPTGAPLCLMGSSRACSLLVKNASSICEGS